jgi:hypothetical protein
MPYSGVLGRKWQPTLPGVNCPNKMQETEDMRFVPEV